MDDGLLISLAVTCDQQRRWTCDAHCSVTVQRMTAFNVVLVRPTILHGSSIDMRADSWIPNISFRFQYAIML